MAYAKSKQRTVKAFERDIELINAQARKIGCSAADVIHSMCEELRKKQYLEELGEAFEVMCSNTEAVRELQAEQNLWDSTLSAGLDDAASR